MIHKKSNFRSVQPSRPKLVQKDELRQTRCFHCGNLCKYKNNFINEHNNLNGNQCWASGRPVPGYAPESYLRRYKHK